VGARASRLEWSEGEEEEGQKLKNSNRSKLFRSEESEHTSLLSLLAAVEAGSVKI